MSLTQHLSPDALTRLVWLLGHPVAHSLSPRMHNAAFRHQGLNLAYLAFDVPPGSLAPAISALRVLGVLGANLTLPHKEAVLELLDDIEPLAAKVGAVNTIVNSDGCLRGHNTDVPGFQMALRSVLPHGANGLRCLVLGAGGAARAVVAALAEDRPASVWLANRTRQRAMALRDSAVRWGLTDCGVARADQAPGLAAEADLLVNATSLGLPDAVKEFPFDVDTLHSGQVVIDLVYGARPTALVRAARDRGAVAIDGREMLVHQAAGSYQLWTGQRAPIDAMRESIDSFER
jgi:shikimate dehydrogenase